MTAFYRKYLSINLEDYPSIGIDLEISKVLLALTIGVIVAAIIISLQRNMLISIVKKLSRLEATAEKSAKTIAELGFKGFYGFICRGLLKSSSRLKKIVARVGEKEYTYEEYVALTNKKKNRKKNKEDLTETNVETKVNPLKEKVDFSTAAFYLKDKNSNETINLVESKTTSVLNTILFCILILSICMILIFLMPSILTAINSAL